MGHGASLSFHLQISTIFSFTIPDTGTKDWGAHAGGILADKGHIEEDEGKASGRCLHVSSLLQTVENECP